MRRGVLLARGTCPVPPVSSGQPREPGITGINRVHTLLPWDCQQRPCAGGAWAMFPVFSGIVLERRRDALPPMCVWVGVARGRSCMQRVSSGAVRQRWRIAPQLRPVRGWPVLCCARGNVLHPMPFRVHKRPTVCHVCAYCVRLSRGPAMLRLPWGLCAITDCGATSISAVLAVWCGHVRNTVSASVRPLLPRLGVGCWRNGVLAVWTRLFKWCGRIVVAVSSIMCIVPCRDMVSSGCNSVHAGECVGV